MLFIFDWDGTLSDSTGKIVACMKAAAAVLEFPELSDSEVQDIIGLGLPEAIFKLYPAASVERREKLAAEYSAQYVADEQVPVLFPGVLDTLKSLRNKGHGLCVATSKSRRGLDRVLQELGMAEFFDATRCADETASKPDPLMLSELLAEMSCLPELAVMVGDTEYDMEMAVAAGVPCVAVSFGAHHIDRLRVFSPVLCVNEVPQLLTLVDVN